MKKFHFFALCIRFPITHSVIFSFFSFSSHMIRKSSQENLPVDFEIRILNFERLYGMSYIKRKRMICRTQKRASNWNSKVMVKIAVTFRYVWSKWPFCTKMIPSGHVTHHSKAYELNIPKKSFSLWKMLLGPSSGKNKKFSKILWWRHNHVKWSESTKNTRIHIIQWNLCQRN